VKVHELEDRLAQRDEQRIVVKLGDIEVAPDASSISVGEDQFLLDEQATAILAKYLKIPVPYLKNCPPDFRATTLEFWRDRHAEADTMLEVLGDDLVSVHSPDLLMLPLGDVGQVVTRVFAPDADVRTFLRDESRLHVDVTAEQFAVDVPNPDRVPGRPEVGDITHGGVRLLAYPTQVKPPVVSTYLCRLACTNGMTTDLKAGQIKLKGHTIGEVLREMEIAANEVLGTLDDQLERYTQTATMAVPGTPLAFAYQLGREANLGSRVMDAVMERVNQLPRDASVYDVNQAFTEVANRGVNYATQLRLQQLGGRLAMDAERTVERCNSCEQLLPS